VQEVFFLLKYREVLRLYAKILVIAALHQVLGVPGIQ